MADFTTYLIFLTVVGLALYYLFGRRPKNFPPGPMGLPLFGNLIEMGQEPYVAFAKYEKKYGPIFSISVGGQRAVILHGAKLIREAFNQTSFSARAPQEAVEEFIMGGKDGILMSNGPEWVDRRRFTLRHLRDFGFGKNSLEGLIMDEVKELTEWIRKQNGKPINFHRRFPLAVVNALWTILSGERYAHDDAKLLSLVNQLEATEKVLLNGKLKSFMVFMHPKFAKSFPNFSGWNDVLASVQPKRKFLADTIKEHEKTLSDGQPRDFIDVYLNEVKETTDPNSVFYSKRAGSSLQAIMTDLFTAGIQSTSTILNWAMVYLVNYEHMQIKLQDELDRVVGKSRLPSLSDRINMPYMEAFLSEILRKAPAPIGVPHATTEDVEFHGFHIPKGTGVISSLYTTHHDPEVWGDPENFRPERFLSPDEKTYVRNDSLIPFAVGKRVCLGETFARDQLFLFTSNLVQQFKIECEEGKPKPSMKPCTDRQGLETFPYTVVLKERL